MLSYNINHLGYGSISVNLQNKPETRQNNRNDLRYNMKMNRPLTSLSTLLIMSAGLALNSNASSDSGRKSPDWDFNNAELGPEWNKHENLSKENYSLTERNGFLRLKGTGKSAGQSEAPAVLARKKEHEKFQASTRFETNDGASAGLTVYSSPSRHADLYVAGEKLLLRSITEEGTTVSEIAAVPKGFIEMKVKGTPESYAFFYSTDGVKFKEGGSIRSNGLASAGSPDNVYVGVFAEGTGYADFDCFKYRAVVPEVSPKLASGHGNPLVDFHFTADPTAVEHDGRLYVYASNDHEQYEGVGRDGKNTYERIKSLVMLSTDDMVNWTYHGLINVGEIAPWVMASWAPSIVKRTEKDGKDHFYLYFSNSGFGTGVLTSTSPVGPWTSPLDKSLVDANTPGLGKCKVPFDPGAVIDDNGTGWLSIGAGNSCIMRLGDDMISVASEMKELKAPHHFEANELNYINGTYVYTYNNDWQDRKDWTSGDVPSKCSMSYMTSKTPLDPDSWQYQHHYLKNPGDYGYDFSNNHTHLHKYKGHWYLFYHTLTLQNSFNTDGGFRNVCVDEINVDEERLDIAMGDQTLTGPAQINPLDPFSLQQAETTAATRGVRFEHTAVPGNMTAIPVEKEALTIVRGVKFGKQPGKCHIMASGKGTIEVRKGSSSGPVIATVNIDSSANRLHKAKVAVKPGKESCDLCFVLKGEGLNFDSWQFR